MTENWLQIELKRAISVIITIMTVKHVDYEVIPFIIVVQYSSNRSINTHGQIVVVIEMIGITVIAVVVVVAVAVAAIATISTAKILFRQTKWKIMKIH